MADVDHASEVEVAYERLHVLDIGVHVVAGVCLGRTAVPAAVVGDDSIALPKEEHQLVVPVVRTQRPAVVEEDWLSLFRAPVLEEDLRAVTGGEKSHGCAPQAALRPAGPVLRLVMRRRRGERAPVNAST